ncbi:hypothetical protein SAMN04489710_1351 [Paracidovorax konjaci]|uniref:Uncharacterized protein n=1 Tax=Paracidovorax konjaci TaxID=32040 RepID=A0A1I1ZNV0_9BURK|nr:hypothetical protein SAMN04489710_1351 [Paracidovorax konjaci]
MKITFKASLYILTIFQCDISAPSLYRLNDQSQLFYVRLDGISLKNDTRIFSSLYFYYCAVANAAQKSHILLHINSLSTKLSKAYQRQELPTKTLIPML